MRFANFAGASVFMTAALLARASFAQDEAPPPPRVVVEQVQPGPAAVPASDTRTEVVSAPNRGLIVSGAVMFGIPYLSSVIVASESDHVGDSHLFVPVLGPWLDLGSRGGCPEFGGCDTETTNKVLLVGDGVLQAVGVLQFVGGFLFPEKEVITTTRPATASIPKVTISPGRMGRGGYGLTALGTF